MQRHFIALITFILTATLSTLSQASEINTRYGSADIGLGIGQMFSSGPIGGTSINPSIGYQSSKWLGAEAGIIYVNGIDTSISIHYFSLRATLPIQKQFNFILKIGAAIGANFNEAAPFTGAGLSYQINKHWSTQLTCQGIGAPFILFAGPVTLGFNYQF